ncbi:MAG TPA: glycosyltransferase family 2 protein [Patescibacteria group bacterium]|nr:glycosyltransferase family 2 protein [Patescibacteria group bacterium]
MATPQRPLVSVIFANWNGKEDVKAYLDSLKKSSLFPGTEVIMVDNNSHDGSVALVRSQYPWVSVFTLPYNRGNSYARNYATQKAKGSFLFYSDNDITIEPNTLTHLLDAFSSYPEAGIVGGKVFKKHPASAIESAGGYGFNPWLGIIYDLPDSDSLQECAFVIGCAMLVKKEVMKSIGGFEETYLKYFEDGDLCFRARYARYRVYYQPHAVIHHGKTGGTVTYDLTKKFTTWYRNQFHFILTHCSFLQIFVSLLFHLTVLPILRYPILRRKQEIPALWYDYVLRYKALLWNLPRLKNIWKKRQELQRFRPSA